ncbi:hypothetical protein HWV00_06715 [Moritella sp. 24]|uniref:hypothetical protein n=1 Tax=Moritella sp. 24 TaxID=2746230 RepID=UPI001BAE0CED|nr:hypothetical protein [Moritella sp. 24]QUM75940.1 hypothetical protein HWV00_06715 [Moritella sp. 24]
MKKLLILSFALALSACDSNDDGSSKSTYSSCQIIGSDASDAGDRSHDLAQCWNASGDGYKDLNEAIQWCEQKISTYMFDTYTTVHSITYAIKSTYCP